MSSNSSLALASERAAGNLSRRAQLILDCARGMLAKYGPDGVGATLTDRGCMRALSFTDMNSVRPRITELVECGLLVVIGSVTCPATGKRVRRWRAATVREIADFQRKLEEARAPRQLDLL